MKLKYMIITAPTIDALVGGVNVRWKEGWRPKGEFRVIPEIDREVVLSEDGQEIMTVYAQTLVRKKK